MPVQSQSHSSEPPSRTAVARRHVAHSADGVSFGTIVMALAALTMALFTYFAN